MRFEEPKFGRTDRDEDEASKLQATNGQPNIVMRHGTTAENDDSSGNKVDRDEYRLDRRHDDEGRRWA